MFYRWRTADAANETRDVYSTANDWPAGAGLTRRFIRTLAKQKENPKNDIQLSRGKPRRLETLSWSFPPHIITDYSSFFRYVVIRLRKCVFNTEGQLFFHRTVIYAPLIPNSWSFSFKSDMCDLMPAAQPAEKIGKMKKLRRTLSESFSRIGECQKTR